MERYKETDLDTGSPKPEKPVSKRTDGPSGGKSPAYNPSAAAKHLSGQDSCAPSNDGPMHHKQ